MSDPTNDNLTKDDVVQLLHNRQGNQTVTAFATSLNVSASYICDIYSGNRDPGPTILKLLKVDKHITYKRWR